MQTPPATTITVDLVPDDESGLAINIKLQTNSCEMNVLVPIAEIENLSDLPNWKPGARRVGSVAGVPAFWSIDDGVVSILVGVDDECWEFGVWTNEEAYQRIVAEARCCSSPVIES